MNTPLRAAAVFAIASFAAPQSVEAADLGYIQNPSYRAYDEPAPSYYRPRACPVDILCYVQVYPGWRGDPYYDTCPIVRVRQTMPDGTVVIRRARFC